MNRNYLDKSLNLVIVCGKMGVGKTSLLCRMAMYYSANGYSVYSNVSMSGFPHYYMHTRDILRFDYSDSILLLDETAVEFSCRQRKGEFVFTDKHLQFFSTVRHRNTYVFLFVQSWRRLDTILRELAHEVWMISPGPFILSRWFSRVSVYNSEIDIIPKSNFEDYEESNIVEFFTRSGSFLFFRPFAYKHYNTFSDEYNFKNLPKPPFSLLS